jgi:hypothetical protein
MAFCNFTSETPTLEAYERTLGSASGNARTIWAACIKQGTWWDHDHQTFPFSENDPKGSRVKKCLIVPEKKNLHNWKTLEICVATRTEQSDLKNNLFEALILITFMILFVIFRFYSSLVYNFGLLFCFLYHLWFIVYLKLYKSWTDFIIIILEE